MYLFVRSEDIDNLIITKIYKLDQWNRNDLQRSVKVIECDTFWWVVYEFLRASCAAVTVPVAYHTSKKRRDDDWISRCFVRLVCEN